MNDEDNIFLNSSASLRQLDVKELKVGMYVAKLDRPWLETTFLFQGFLLKNEADIQAVREQCRYVYIDVEKQGKSPNSTQRHRRSNYPPEWLKSTPPEKKSTFEKEFHQAEHVHQKTSTLVRNFMQEIRLGGGINVTLAKQAVAECVNSVLASPDALIWMTQLKQRDLYTSQHSMNVAIYAIALGRHINLPVPELNNLGLCGMMHDMGKMRIPLEVLNKPGKLTEAELKIMQSHAEIGWKLLLSSSGMYPGAIDVAYSHHECLDGTGYPRGLTGDQTTPYTKMVAIVDMYDAITSDRIYQNGRTHLEALSIMTKLCNSHLDSGLTYKFIECLGIYPPGSVVEMTNGEIAIVAEVNPKQKIKPKIILLLDESKRPQTERVVDLSKLDLDAAGQPYGIRKIVRAEQYNIDIQKYYNQGVIAKALAGIT